jgi:hypothetical protein
MRRRATGVVWAAVLAWGVCVNRPAFGQDQAAGAAIPADVVKLKDGSLYRGTIMEMVAGDHVDLRLSSGEVKRFEMNAVNYAGSAEGQPGARAAREGPPARPLVTVEANEARIHFESNTPNADFHIRTGETTVAGVGWGGRGAFAYGAVAHGYDHICTAPCNATLPAGRHRLALSINNKGPLEPEDPVAIDGPSRIRGTYEDRSATRIAGWVIFSASLGVGMAMALAAVLHSTPDCTDQAITGMCLQTFSTDTTLLAAGGVVMGVGAIVGIVLALQRDHVTIEVTPMDAGLRWPALARREAAWIATDVGAASGLGLRLRF